MQPGLSEYIGSLGVFHGQQPPQFIFDSTASLICSFNSHKLECFINQPDRTRLLLWIPSLHLKSVLENSTEPSCDASTWSISNVSFIQTDPNTQSSLLVVIENSVHDRSVICHLDLFDKSKNTKVITVHGILSSIEWIQNSHIPYDFVKSDDLLLNDTDSLLSVTMETTGCDAGKIVPKRNPPITALFSGCVALGFRHGLVGLLDMCLDWDRTEFPNCLPEYSVVVEKSHCISYLSTGQRISQLEFNKREHVMVYLDANVLRWNDFIYKSVSGKVLSSIPSACVYVSALRHIPQLQALAIGYSFGGWQLWSLRNLKMEFCLRQTNIMAPVVSFNFLEPSDDPRFCSYLWVGWQSKVTEFEEQVNSKNQSKFDVFHPVVKLFQMSFRRRFETTCHSNQDYVMYYYQDLIGIAERLSTTLSGGINISSGSSNLGIRGDTDADEIRPNYLLSMQSIHEPQDFYLDTSNSLVTTRLSVFIWKITNHVIRIGLFDLDRWYHAQMPTHIRSDNSFFAIFDASISNNKLNLVSGYLIESSLVSFWSRIAKREYHQMNLCRPFNKIDFDSSDNSFESNKLTLHKRPVPEVCLRPSALSFKFLLIWTNNNDITNTTTSSIGGTTFTTHNNNSSIKTNKGFEISDLHRNYQNITTGLSQLQFNSRQESCLLLLKNFISKTKLEQFDVKSWLSELWATGLLESPGLDLIEDDELVNILRLANNNHNNDNVNLMISSSTIGVSLSYGEDFDQNLLNDLDQLLNLYGLDENELFTNHHTIKRARLSINNIGNNEKIGNKYCLHPCWVLICNCLLEHGCLSTLKSIDKLVHGPNAPVNMNFKLSWIWLRFHRLKARFDRSAAILFNSKIDSLNNSFAQNLKNSDLYEFGSVINQINQLRDVAKYWFEPEISLKRKNFNSSKKKSTSLQHPICLSMETYIGYTKVVLFLYRLGLLPQTCITHSNSIDVNENYHSVWNSNTLLFSYNPNLLIQIIDKLHKRSSWKNPHLYITEQLLHTSLLFDRSISSPDSMNKSTTTTTTNNNNQINAAYHKWQEHEQSDNQQDNNETHFQFAKGLYYPPKNLQSLCILWQSELNNQRQINYSRLCLLGFLLCDTIAGVFLIQSVKNQTKCIFMNENSQLSWDLNVLRLCRHVMSLFSQEFPTVRRILPTIILLWLLDRGCFKEALSSDLIEFIINPNQNLNSKLSGLNNFNYLVNLFPNQTNIISQLLHSYYPSNHDEHDQSTIYIKKLLRQFNLIYPNFHEQNTISTHFHHQSSSFSLTLFNEANLKPVGSPYLALSKLRNLINRINQFHYQVPLGDQILEKTNQLASDSLIYLAEACRRAGRISDLLNLGLTDWEAKTLFDYYYRTGQHNLLFHCLIVRSQYQVALCALKDLKSTYSQQHQSTNTTSTFYTPSHSKMNTVPLNELNQLNLMTNLLKSCLPSNNEQNNSSKLNYLFNSYKALANQSVKLSNHSIIDDMSDDSENSMNYNDSNNSIPIPTELNNKSKNNNNDNNLPSCSQSFTSPTMFVSYSQYNSIKCPLTNQKLSQSNHINHKFNTSRNNNNNNNDLFKQHYHITNNIHNLNYDTDDMEYDEQIPDRLDNNLPNIRNHLLSIDRKCTQEFWDTFRELETLQRSCGLSMDSMRLNCFDLSMNSTNNNSTNSSKSFNVHHSLKKLKRANQSKSIYTPPSCNRKNKAQSRHLSRSPSVVNSFSSSSVHRSVDSKLNYDRSEPISILKTRTSNSSFSNLSKYTNLTSLNKSATDNMKQSIQSNDPNTIENEYEFEDNDVTINLSTIRPSLITTPKNPVPNTPTEKTIICKEFEFSAPRRLSFSSRLVSPDPVKKSDYEFSKPLSYQFNMATTPDDIKPKTEQSKSSVMLSNSDSSEKEALNTDTMSCTVDFENLIPLSSVPLLNLPKSNYMKSKTIESTTKSLPSPLSSISSYTNTTTTATTTTYYHDNDINDNNPEKDGNLHLTEISTEFILSLPPLSSHHSKQQSNPMQKKRKPKSNTKKLVSKNLDSKTDLNELDQNEINDLCGVLEDNNDNNNYDENDDTCSVTSSVTESSIISETPRRSGRRVRAPKRYDASGR